jgi:hypothetical protein
MSHSIIRNCPVIRQESSCFQLTKTCEVSASTVYCRDFLNPIKNYLLAGRGTVPGFPVLLAVKFVHQICHMNQRL